MTADKDISKEMSVFNIEQHIMRYANQLKKHGLEDLLNVKPILKVSSNKLDSKTTVTAEQTKCTCPIKLSKKIGKKKAKRQRQRETFFIGGTNNNGYEINCPIHGRRTGGL